MASLPLCSSSPDSSSSPMHLLHSPLYSPSPHSLYSTAICCAKPLPHSSHRISVRKHKASFFAVSVNLASHGAKLLVNSAGAGSEILTSDAEEGEDGDKVDHEGAEDHQVETIANCSDGDSIVSSSPPGESPSLGIREPVYEVVEVSSDGVVSIRKINRRQLLKSSGLRPRDIRSVDPSLWLTNSMPALLVREHALLLNMGSLRAIAMQECVYIFNYNRRGGKAFLDSLLPRLNPRNSNGGPSMPFELEVVEAALHSRIQRLEQRLMDLEPNVQALLEVLPNRLTADVLEQLRTSKQTLVELGSRAGALRQMLLDLLEDPHEIRRICVMGRNCTLKKGNDDMECSVPLEKQIAEEEEEEIEMLLENYLQRCESCHSQSERLLDSAREMEDSISVNLSSRRLEVSRVELLLQVGTFCVAVGALVAGIFGMNLKSYLEEHVLAFWVTTAGIIAGAVVAFFLMYWYLRKRKIL
uniref:Magnesium transporter n=1 Tax=Kalanchoe fedtschenkoi TaxID=63787 RepID=A0A7N1A8T4_KALFE